ncbi:hypothetical protein NE865_05815 [Phthorimaea operculella]|nr:hypothetical protein NE865_05815 [Phthorimaea operculella]
MEAKLRTETRRQFTKKCNVFGELLSQKPQKAEISQVIATFKAIAEYKKELDRLDKIICDKILTDFEEEKLQKECDEAEKYREKWLLIETKYEIFLNQANQHSGDNNNHNYNGRNYNLRLPMLEIPKFDGRLETWLPFWNQYKKIDEDANLDREINLDTCYKP